jgi:DNA-binding transcriptional ArsR family regulator
MAQPKFDRFQAIGDPSRRQILLLLSKGSLTINSLVQNFEMSRPAVSKHVKILHMTGYISIEDKGRERYCRLNQEGFSELQKWIDYFDVFWKSKLNKLETVLNHRTTIKNK